MSQHPIPVLLYDIINDIRARDPDKPALIGVGGAQGSGKSYQCRMLAMTNQPRFAHFSLDDVYLTKAERETQARFHCQTIIDHPPLFGPTPSREERERIARDIYPLLVTRGPPGTHDLGLASGLVARLGQALKTPLARFDKGTDDRAPPEIWPVFRGPAEAILIDGWCLGASIPPDSPPMNEIEARDASGEWRISVNTSLQLYQPFFNAFDAMIYLQAPSWEIVRVWRGQQEEQTLGRPLSPEENAALDRFVMHYERITRSMLAGNHSAKWIVHLDEARNVVRIEER